MPPVNLQQIDDTGGPQAWFQSLPLVTRYWFGAALITTCAGNFGFVSPMKLIYIWDNVWDNFEIWRFLTPFLFVGKFDFNTLMALYMLQSFSQRYETEPYNTGAGGGTADYVFAIMILLLLLLCRLTRHVTRSKQYTLSCVNLVTFILTAAETYRYR